MNDLFFVFSKIAWTVLSPGNLLLILFILGTLYLLFDHRTMSKRILLPTALVSFLVMAFPVGDYLIRPLEERFSKPQELPESVDGILVLGGGEDLQRSLSWQSAELGLGGDRYIGAAKLAKIYPKVPVIFSGGSGSVQLQNSGKESDLASELLTTVGIEPNRLILESDSRNTYENFINTLPLLPKGDGTYLLVTSAYHMPRAVGIARNLEINVIPYPVDYRSNSPEYRHWDFDLFDHLKSLEPAVKEWIGLSIYLLTGKTERWFPSPDDDR